MSEFKKLEIKTDDCIACNACTSSCPEVFQMNDDNVAEVKPDADLTKVEEIEEAIKICPTEAIVGEKSV